MQGSHNNKESRFNYAVQRIEAMVREGGFAPGDKLPPAREMCEDLGVSRTVLREALRVVESRGLISIQAGKGVYINKLDLDGLDDRVDALVASGKVEIVDLIQARHFLEPGIAHIAAIRATDNDIQNLEKCLKGMIDYLEVGDAFMQADQNFHLLLAHATKNPILFMMAKTLTECLAVFRKTIYEVEGAPAKAVQRHQDILNAVKGHDSRMAYQAMEDHIIDAEEHQRVRMMQISLNHVDFETARD